MATMNPILFKMHLDMHEHTTQQTIHVKRGDTKNKLIVTLMEYGKVYVLPEKVTAMFSARKPDKKPILNDCEVDGNTIVYSITGQTTAVVGNVECELRIYDAKGELLSSPTFIIAVDDTIYADGEEIESTYEMDALTKLMQGIKNGLSAYEIAVKHGFEGTEAEWLDSLGAGVKEIQNITSIDTIYDDVSELPTTGVSNGTRWLALTKGKTPLTIYTFNAADGEWLVVDECRGSTAYLVLTGKKAGIYRFTMASPYLVSVESHTLEESKDYTDKKIANLVPTEGLVYELNSTGEHYGCSGIGTATAKDIVIASEYNGVPVKYVAGYAFKGSDITSVTIPSSVVDIALNAFENCKSLKRVNLSNGLERIGEAAFSGCSNLSNIWLPTTLTAIYGKAFYGCVQLLQVYIPNSVTMIKFQAFMGCVSLVSAYWSDPKVTVEVGEAIFNACSNLNRIKLPKSVTSIPGGTYVGCESITSLNIPDNVTSIGTKAYQGCDALINIIIPKNVTTIGLGAFYDCDGLKTITFPDNVTQFVDAVISGEQIEEITVPFVGRTKGNTTYNKFKDIIYNGDVATAVPSLKKVIISSACDTMVANAFEGVSGVTICCQAESKPEGWDAKWNSNNLPVIWGYVSESEEIAELKGSIGDISTTLDGLYAYERGEPTEGLQLIKNSAGTAYELIGLGTATATDIVIPGTYDGLPVQLRDWLVMYNKTVTRIKVLDGVTSIPMDAFSQVSNLTELILPDSVYSLGTTAIHDCPNLKKLVLGEGLRSVGQSGISFNKSLEYLELPKTLTSLPSGALQNNDSLKKIIIPKSVTSMGDRVFHGCPNLTIYCEAESKPEGWDANWNPENRPVVWGYKSNEEEIAGLKASIGDISTALDELHAYAQSLIGGDS